MRTLPRLTFKQWRAKNRAVEERLRREVEDDFLLTGACFDCDGDGGHDWDCDPFGPSGYHSGLCRCDPCLECGGTGIAPLHAIDRGLSQDLENRMRQEYDAVVAREDALLDRMVSPSPVGVG